jgi:hypothetical protein
MRPHHFDFRPKCNASLQNIEYYYLALYSPHESITTIVLGMKEANFAVCLGADILIHGHTVA